MTLIGGKIDTGSNQLVLDGNSTENFLAKTFVGSILSVGASNSGFFSVILLA
jgi:hypothetical protein